LRTRKTYNQGKVTVKHELLLEDDGRKVDDSVAATNLLHDLRTGSDEHTPEVLGWASGEDILLAARLGSLKRVEDDAGLVDDNVRVEGSGLESGHDVLSLGEIAVRNEPTRRLGEELDHDEEGDGEDALKGDGNAPGSGGGDEGESIVDPERAGKVSASPAEAIDGGSSPVGDGGSRGNHGSLDTDEKSTVVTLGRFSVPGRDGLRWEGSARGLEACSAALQAVEATYGGVGSVTETRNNTANDELGLFDEKDMSKRDGRREEGSTNAPQPCDQRKQ
jgi:hypothetical protein